VKDKRSLPPVPERLVTRHELLLRQGFEEGGRRYGILGLPQDQYARGVLARLLESMARSGQPTGSLDSSLKTRVLEDLYLVLACDHGRPNAWEVFRERFASAVRGRALWFLRREGAALDMAADILGELSGPSAWEGVHHRLGEYNGQASLEGWLNTITANRCRDALRRERRFIAVEFQADCSYGSEEEGESPEDALVSRDFRAALETAGHRMSAKESLALQLTYFEALKLREIAPLLGLSIARTQKIVKSAVVKIREESEGIVPPSRWGVLERTAHEWLSELAGRTNRPGDRGSEGGADG